MRVTRPQGARSPLACYGLAPAPSCCPKMIEAAAGRRVERDTKDGTLSVNSCGGCCYALIEVRFCPFCGKTVV